MYLRYSGLIEKQVFKNILISSVGITISVLMFHIFIRNSLIKIKIFEFKSVLVF